MSCFELSKTSFPCVTGHCHCLKGLVNVRQKITPPCPLGSQVLDSFVAMANVEGGELRELESHKSGQQPMNLASHTCRNTSEKRSAPGTDGLQTKSNEIFSGAESMIFDGVLVQISRLYWHIA